LLVPTLTEGDELLPRVTVVVVVFSYGLVEVVTVFVADTPGMLAEPPVTVVGCCAAVDDAAAQSSNAAMVLNMSDAPLIGAAELARLRAGSLYAFLASLSSSEPEIRRHRANSTHLPPLRPSDTFRAAIAGRVTYVRSRNAAHC
jgi:hypothetical protein